MTTRTIPADLDAWFGDSNKGNGNGKYMTFGKGTGDWAWINRGALQFSRGNHFDGVPSSAAISGGKIKMKASNANSGIGSAVSTVFDRGTQAFTAYQVVAGRDGIPAGANISAYVSSGGPASGEYPGPPRDSTHRGSYTGHPSNGDWIGGNLNDMIRWWYDHPEVDKLIVVGLAQDETDASQRLTVNTIESGSVPYLEFEVSTNRPPDAPTDTWVDYGADGTSVTVSGTGHDPDGDTMTKVRFVLTPDATN